MVIFAEDETVRLDELCELPEDADVALKIKIELDIMQIENLLIKIERTIHFLQ